ncbi:MAG: hypothetical protein FJZ78_03590 [Bacteroidetes bacterium]|nr:hypothetical protein [Bacteroidota bacterium]
MSAQGSIGFKGGLSEAEGRSPDLDPFDTFGTFDASATLRHLRHLRQAQVSAQGAIGFKGGLSLVTERSRGGRRPVTRPRPLRHLRYLGYNTAPSTPSAGSGVGSGGYWL